MPVPIGDLDVSAANEALDELGADPAGADVAHTLGRFLHTGAPDAPDADLLFQLYRASPLVTALAREAPDAVALDDLVARVVGPTATPALAATGTDPAWALLLSRVVAALGHVRAVAGRAALSIEAHLWVRELTRIDRSADPTARFRWSDDGPPAATTVTDQGVGDVRPSFPAVYCRFCGRSGWGVALAPVGAGLAASDESIRRDHAGREGRFRPLLYAPVEAETVYAGGRPTDGLVWFSVRHRELRASPPAEDDADLRDGWVLPVLTSSGREADDDARDDTCPACEQKDGIRFLGSAIATLLSVSLSTLFGSHRLDPSEKKALVFTDSVQDAAHRAGFVQARSHTLTLRGVLRAALAAGPLPLDQLVDEVVRDAGDDPFARYRLLAPDCADRDSFSPFWTASTARTVPQSVRSRVRKRLGLDAALEFGLNSRTGRTLELTGGVTVEVEAGQATKTAALARAALAAAPQQGSFDGELDDATLARWVRGVLDRMRSQGAIEHPWFDRFRREDGNRWSISGGRPRQDGMPAFPRGRPAPGYPRVGGTEIEGLEPVTSSRSWYAQWTSRALGVSPHDGGRWARLLLDRLAREGVLTATTTTSQATVYALPSDRVILAPVDPEALPDAGVLLTCDTCRSLVPGSPTTVAQLAGAPCLLVRCRGHLALAPLADNFYRRLYDSPDMRRVVAREHTSLLDDETRLAHEDGFKGADTSPQAPNVLVATPTLEMGIDIGDLSTVMLSSLPRTVAAYLQRVGRAGRLTGNALDLAYLTGRGDQLPRLGDPLSVINGEVRPPATYLEAEEILRRQYTAHLVDEFARDPARRHPRSAPGALGSTEPGTFLGDLLAHAETHPDEHVGRFVSAFDGLPEPIVERLHAWVDPPDGPGTSAFAAHLHHASGRWQRTVETLRHRLDAVDEVLPGLEAQASSPAATDDDQRALRSARTARKLTAGQLGHLRGEYWVGVLEEYGLLPNYTLLDDSVSLDVGLSWTDPDSGEFRSEHAQFQRGSAQAIREFAPGARFYARGYEITIDAVDLGVDQVAVRPWRYCPACGYAVDVEPEGVETPVPSCPRCGSTGIADTGQRLDVVELTHVTAELRRDEVIISDRRDQRNNTVFRVVTAADVDPAQIEHRWFVDGVGLGCTLVRAIDLRWLNIGVPGHGSARVLAGNEHSGALFRVCSGCGKLDTDAGVNRPHEHRPWCRYRTSDEEHTSTVALSRTLRTQGLLLRLPTSVTIGDDFAAPSIAAAVLLGLRERLGGHPDHLRIEQVVDPTLADGSANHDAILLHDAVPGGTGYLAGLAEPEHLRALLLTAWETVRDCECRHEARQACHRCLLPFVAPGQVSRVSRASAERHLHRLLGLDVGLTEWTVTAEAPPEDPESHLEQRFRTVLVGRLRTLGAAVTEVPGASGNTVRFTLPGQPRQWTLTPQVAVEGSKPDFVLQTGDTTLPDVAVFTDGRTFHATVGHNRLADDAAKREVLRDTGRIVLAVTLADVVAAEKGLREPPWWFAEATVQSLIAHPSFMAAPAAYDALRAGPVEWLLSWVQSPTPSDVRSVARAVPMFLLAGASPVALPAGAPLEDAARSALLDEPLPRAGDRVVRVHRRGACAVAVESVGPVLHAALVLDDRESALDGSHGEAWQDWLRLSNALALRDWSTTITTTGRVAEPSSAAVPAPVEAESASLPAAYTAPYAEARSEPERALLRALAERGSTPAPAMGAEGPDGIPVDMSWPDRRLAVALPDMPAEDREDLEAAGWHLVEPDADLIAAALAGATSEGTS